MLVIKSLSKRFADKLVLNQISFSIGSGSICGLFGPNGSGKTTLLNILMGMIHATSGTFQVAKGIKVGMSVSRKGFFNDMSVRDNIFLIAKLLGVPIPLVHKTMDDFMIDFGRLQFSQLSAGMKQRVSLLIPFLDNNELILLDEPSNHLDIDSMLILRKKILEFNEKGVSFLITSHILSELEKVCDRILFLKGGEIKFDRYTSELIQEYSTLENAYLSLK